MNSYISLDLETTGLNPKYEKIIEVGAVKVIDGEIVDKFSSFINPGRQLEQNISELTGITADNLVDAPMADLVIPALLEFCEDLPLLGHRILFDYSFVKKAAVLLKLPFAKEGVDTLKICRACFPELPSKRLTAMCEHYGIVYSAHRALNDAEATSQLYEYLKRDFSSKYPHEFVPQKLVYEVKKESPIRPQQIERIKSFVDRFKLDCPYEIEKMSRNEASRYIDKIISEYGK